MGRSGVFPGSFDPLTVAHLAIVDAARDQCRLDSVDLVISTVPLAKEHRAQPDPDARAAAIRAARGDRQWMHARVTDRQLLVDIATGYDVLIMGADKWLQLHDPRFYGDSEDAMRRSLARLPEVAVAPRAGVELPDDGAVILALPDEHHEVSSTAVREGTHPHWRA